MTREELREKYLNKYELKGDIARKYNACVAPLKHLSDDVKDMYSVIDSRFFWRDLSGFFTKLGIATIAGYSSVAGAVHYALNANPLYDGIFSDLLMYAVPACLFMSGAGALSSYIIEKKNESSMNGIKRFIENAYEVRVKTQDDYEKAFGQVAFDLVGQSLNDASAYASPVDIIKNGNDDPFSLAKLDVATDDFENIWD